MPLSGYLRGVDVIGETSLLVTCEAQTFHWVGYGLKLHIPQGSLPIGVKECRVYIKAALTGQFKFPCETELMSAVYHLQCPEKFSHPLTVEIQHCAKPISRSSLGFVLAKCSQKELPYTFKPIKDSGVFTSYSSYGSISISQFSFVGIIYRRLSALLSPIFPVPNPREYCGQVFYKKSSPGRNIWNATFVIIQNLEVCFNVSNLLQP